MEGALSLIGLAAVALLVVAIAVAWWEQTASDGRHAAPARPQSVLTVDLHLDHLADAPPQGDQATREAVLGHTIARMTQPAPSSQAWMETQPMVAPSGRADPVPSSWG